LPAISLAFIVYSLDDSHSDWGQMEFQHPFGVSFFKVFLFLFWQYWFKLMASLLQAGTALLEPHLQPLSSSYSLDINPCPVKSC
jgi:hypothetical protein